MKQLKYSAVALLAMLGVAAVPSLASANEVSSTVTGLVCTVNNYGNYSCVPRHEVTVRRRNISYVDTRTVTNIEFLGTSMSTQTKVALGSLMAIGLLGVAVKTTRFAK
jgi:hypothetical protein